MPLAQLEKQQISLRFGFIAYDTCVSCEILCSERGVNKDSSLSTTTFNSAHTLLLTKPRLAQRTAG
jgi:hypothetical protein